MKFKVAWCPQCTKISVRLILFRDLSESIHQCDCGETLIITDVDLQEVDDILRERNTQHLSKEELVEILL